MSVGRRDFIVGTLGTAAAAQLLGCSDDEASNSSVGELALDTARFTHGVASGDPLADKVILWTRAVSADGQPAMIEWVIAKDPALSDELQRGVTQSSATSDFTVKVDVAGLAAGTTYYYAFFVSGAGRSPIGRTRTLPTSAARARLAFTSCANFQNGYFNAYRAIANRLDLDVWVHVGDYIYEYAAGTYADPMLPARAHLPAKEAVTLADYRGRYAQYRTDPDLLEVHRQHPLIIVWDDHEFANNANTDGAENHSIDGSEGSWVDRKRAGSQAFLEWLPIRAAAGDPVAKIYRSFPFADLFDLIMLDTRMWARTPQAGNDMGAFDGTNVGEPADWTNPARHIVGDEQEGWIEQQLGASKTRGAKWRLIGNQVMFTQGRAPLDQRDPAYILFSDFWDGYQYDRDRVLNYIANNGVQNTVFLTGDIHSSWALEISKNPFDPNVYDPATGKNAVAVELVGPSVTSQALEGNPLATAAPGLIARPNPHLKYAEFTKKGYVLIDVDATRLQAEWWYVNDFKTPNAAETAAKIFTVASTSARLIEATVVSAAAPNPPAAAPA
ncbi:MAG TPA: alkaline phosphatase D family protein [Polyangiales bacterium]|nr:alkaline phosphatase D family protein [Polyangiales bacterium]